MSLKDVRKNLPTQGKTRRVISDIDDGELVIKHATADQKLSLGLGQKTPMDLIAENVRGSDGARMSAKEWDQLLSTLPDATNEIFEIIFQTVGEEELKN